MAELEGALRQARVDPTALGWADEHNGAIDRALAGSSPAPSPLRIAEAVRDATRQRIAALTDDLTKPPDNPQDRAYLDAIADADVALSGMDLAPIIAKVTS